VFRQEKRQQTASFHREAGSGTAVAPSSAVAERRRDKRFRCDTPVSGAVLVFHDVAVQQQGSDEWISISRQSATVGETLLLEVVQDDPLAGETRRRLPVCVIESRPVLVDGDMHHRIRLDGGIWASVWFEQQVRRGEALRLNRRVREIHRQGVLRRRRAGFDDLHGHAQPVSHFLAPGFRTWVRVSRAVPPARLFLLPRLADVRSSAS
jgi:hypothetical protein